MNYLHGFLKNLKLDNENEVELQFVMRAVCVLGLILSFCHAGFYFLIKLYSMFVLMAVIFCGFLAALFYCRKSGRNAYKITYLFFCAVCILTHVFITYYFGNCGTIFLIFGVLIAPHIFKFFKPGTILVLDIFFIIVINLVFLISFYTVPAYANMAGSAYKIILTNIGLLICLFELYINIFSQDFIKLKRQKLIEAASKDAALDALTDLGNRRMLEIYKADLENAASNGFSLCVAIADIDFFKLINDKYGHTMGDNVIRFMTNTMKAFFRKSDLLIRWGGDEFLVLLRYMTIDDAEVLMEKFRLKMQNSPMILAGEKIPVHLTIGLKEHRPNTSIYDTINAADELMYQGKLQGRNRVIVEK